MTDPRLRDQCVKDQTPPRMERGDTTEVGCFFRNLKREHVAKHYEKDNDEGPEYGYKITGRHWREADKAAGAFSVNFVNCIHSPECSIAIQSRSEEYYHVACIDLAQVNELGALTTRFVAQYQPVEENQNWCHFEILPRDGTILKWMELYEILEGPFPPGRLPQSKEEKRQAESECERYTRILQILRWVRPRRVG